MYTWAAFLGLLVPLNIWMFLHTSQIPSAMSWGIKYGVQTLPTREWTCQKGTQVEIAWPVTASNWILPWALLSCPLIPPTVIHWSTEFLTLLRPKPSMTATRLLPYCANAWHWSTEQNGLAHHCQENKQNLHFDAADWRVLYFFFMISWKGCACLLLTLVTMDHKRTWKHKE